MNAPELMKICQKLAPMLKLTPKETWELMDVALSVIYNKPMIDLIKLDEILYRDQLEPTDKSSSDLVLEKYGQEILDYIKTMI